MRYEVIAIYLAAIALVLAFGIAGTYFIGQHNGFNVPITGVVEAAYFTVATMSTVGYGDIVPVTDSARIFVIVLIIVGIGVFFSIIVAVSGEFMNNRIETINGRVTGFEKRLLNKHIILVGSSATNTYIAEKLYEKHERFIIITSNPTNAENLKRLGYRAYLADSTSEVEMREFEPNHAKAIIIDLEDPSRAIYALLVAKELAGSAKIIVVAPSKAAEHHLRNIAGGRARILNPADIVASTISESLFK